MTGFYQTQNVKKEIHIIKENQIEIIELKIRIT